MSVATDSARRELIALLDRAAEKRLALGLPSPDTTAFRLFSGAADGLAGFTIDVYGEFHVLASFRDDARLERLLAEACAERGARGVYVKRRPRQANTLSEAERRERAPVAPLVGEAAPDPLLIMENGVRFAVRLGDGLSTGIFLDQRENRRRLRELAAGTRVLNLFAYTCGFGLVAAIGGAAHTVNLDIAKNALERGRVNYELNGVALEPHQFLARDARDMLLRFAKQGRTFSRVVLDPPSYSTSKQLRFRLEDMLPELVAGAVRVLEPEGVALVSGNHAGLSAEAFRALVERGLAAVGREAQLEMLAAPREYSTFAAEGSVLRSVWLELR